MGICLGKDRNTMDSINENNTEWLSFDGKLLRSKVIDVYDADTITVIIPFEKHYYKTKCRLFGIDGAEKRMKKGEKCELEVKNAHEGTEYVKNLILNKEVWIRCGNWDKYGRLLGTVYLKYNQSQQGWDSSVNVDIVKQGFAYYYDGKKKQAFSEWKNGSQE